MTARKKTVKKTPIRDALTDSSILQSRVHDGIAAMENSHRVYLAVDIRGGFGDSLDMDTSLQPAHPAENRWDYLLGHTPTRKLIAVEPHSAKEDQVSTIIRKRTAAKQQLVPHLKAGRRVDKWIWVASGSVQFSAFDKQIRRLDENGIEFAGKQVQAKHLPKATMKSSSKRG